MTVNTKRCRKPIQNEILEPLSGDKVTLFTENKSTQRNAKRKTKFKIE
jgi:hypothetical protein